MMFLLFFLLLNVNLIGYSKYTDDTILDLVCQFIPLDPTILEAGANMGEDTNKMKRKWPLSRIHSFEPHPYSHWALLKNTRFLRNVTCYPMCLNDMTGVAPFFCCKEDAGSSSLLHLPEWRKAVRTDNPPILIKCITLDDWSCENGIAFVDFMWLDLEGAELKVLRGGERLLKTVKAIYVEVNFQEYRVGMVQYQEIKNFLEEHGFSQIYITPGISYDVQANALFVRTE